MSAIPNFKAIDAARSRIDTTIALDARREQREAAGASQANFTPSEDSVALAFAARHSEFRYVPPWHRWLRWDGMSWREDSAGTVYARIRELVRSFVEGSRAERSTANAAFVAGVEKLLRTDPRIVVLPEQLDADPWLLNTLSGIVDLRTGEIRAHDKSALMTKITGAGVDPTHGAELWREFLDGITRCDAGLAGYLQRVAGYCATGVVTEDALPYLFGIGANGKSSFAEAVAAALGDYARQFPPEVLMESRGERHPTEVAQFMGVRFALTSEPSASATWNDSRVKSLTGDAKLAARYMRGDFFEFSRTHKTIVIGNHMPRLNEVTHAIRRRVQMVPFRAVFAPTPGTGMRERIKAEALGAVLAWIVEGARLWAAKGTSPPPCVRELTDEYLSDQDVFGQWLDEACERDPRGMERASDLHRSYKLWCERAGVPADSLVRFAATLIGAGFERYKTAGANMYRGLRRRGAR